MIFEVKRLAEAFGCFCSPGDGQVKQGSALGTSQHCLNMSQRERMSRVPTDSKPVEMSQEMVKQ